MADIQPEQAEDAPGPDALQRATLSDQIADLLLARMREEAMQPGDPLPAEARLARAFAVSRPVVREALMKLKSLGLIEMASGRPAMVRKVDGRLPRLFFERSVAQNLGDVRELLEVRRGLEVESAMLAARRAGEADRARLAATLAGMEAPVAEGRLEPFIECDVDLHMQIARASGNRILAVLLAALREPMRASIREGLAARDSLRELDRIQGTHRAIVAAIGRGDGAAAAAAMARHFDEALEAIMARTGGGGQ